MKRTFFIWTVVAITLCARAFPSCGSDKLNSNSESANLLREVLESERLPGSESVARRTLLKPGSRPVTDPDAIWWQAGYAKSGKGWKPFEETVPAGNDADRLDQYRKQRLISVQQPHSEWKLANWCRKNGLLDQERVHLLRAIASRDAAVDRTAAYERLGYQRFGDSWVSPQELRDTQRIAAEAELSHRRWNAKLTRLLNGLEGNSRERAQAEKTLEGIDDPVAVPAIVSSLCMNSESNANIGVRTLGQISEFQASRALAGQAVFSRWRTVRTQAIELLKQRKLEEFAPDLLIVLTKPIQIKNEVGADSVGFSQAEAGNVMKIEYANWDFAWIDESHDTIRIGIQRLFPYSTPMSLNRIDSDGRFGDTEALPVPSRLGNSMSQRAMLDLFDQAATLEHAAGAVNEFRTATNERVGKVLSECTGEQFTADPGTWWKWWADYSSIVRPDSKNVVIVDERISQPSFAIRQIAPPSPSCLVAGTLIWTEVGFVDIEKILPGDRVLSKDIDSGELSYKPVLQVTERAPTPVTKIHLAGESIEASAGHHFWVSGEGWTKTRQLKSGQPIHTVTGMHRVEDLVDEERTAKVYNLIVADAHTYFVGRSMILSHDVLLPAPSNVKIPGLVAQ